jgi:hypothetical protein
MKLSIVRGGGLAPVVTRTELDADHLAPDATGAFHEKVAAVGPLEEPPSAREAALPDELQYEVTLEDGGEKRSAQFSDSSLPSSLRALIEWADARPEQTTQIEPLGGPGATA